MSDKLKADVHNIHMSIADSPIDPNFYPSKGWSYPLDPMNPPRSNPFDDYHSIKKIQDIMDKQKPKETVEEKPKEKAPPHFLHAVDENEFIILLPLAGFVHEDITISLDRKTGVITISAKLSNKYLKDYLEDVTTKHKLHRNEMIRKVSFEDDRILRVFIERKEDEPLTLQVLR